MKKICRSNVESLQAWMQHIQINIDTHTANKGLTMSKDMKASEAKSQTPAGIKIWYWQLSRKYMQSAWMVLLPVPTRFYMHILHDWGTKRWYGEIPKWPVLWPSTQDFVHHPYQPCLKKFQMRIHPVVGWFSTSILPRLLQNSPQKYEDPTTPFFQRMPLPKTLCLREILGVSQRPQH